MNNNKQPEEDEPKNRVLKPDRGPDNSTALIVLSALVVALIVGGVVFAWQNSRLNRVKEEKNEEIQALQDEISELEKKIESKEEDTDASDEKDQANDYTTQANCEDVGYFWYDDSCHEEAVSADWETYENKEYGFKIKYPQDWSLHSSSSPGMGVNWRFMLKRSFEGLPEDSLQFSLSVYEDKEMAPGELLQAEVVRTEEKNIASRSTKIFTYSDDFKGAGPGITFKKTGRYAWIEKDGLYFLLEGNVAGDLNSWLDKEKVFDEILSTFEFTN